MIGSRKLVRAASTIANKATTSRGLIQSVEVGERENEWKDEGDGGPDIGNEAEHGRQAAPEHGVRHPDQPEPDSDHQPESRVDQRESRQVPADPLSDLLHGARRQGHVAMAEDGDDPIS